MSLYGWVLSFLWSGTALAGTLRGDWSLALAALGAALATIWGGGWHQEALRLQANMKTIAETVKEMRAILKGGIH